MKASLILKYLEYWAPKGAAWAKDNVGLQIGNPEKEINGIFLALDASAEAIRQAVEAKCDLIITHHPLLFNPLKKLDFQKDFRAKIVSEIIKKDIILYSAHTNLDFTKGGVSFQLAEKLGLQKIKFLENEKGNQYKLTVFIPEESLEKVMDAVFSSGAGVIGEYQKCGFFTSGTGTFEGSDASAPYIGESGQFEKASEYRAEFLVNAWSLSKAVDAMLKAHPYEEPAYDVYPLSNKNVNFGIGTIGELEKIYQTDEFLSHVCANLGVESLRYCVGKKDQIRRVAVCGGSGAELVNKAIDAGADAFVTADVKYHIFQDAENKTLLVDAGHYQTEIIALEGVKKRLEKFLADNNSNVKVNLFSGQGSPMRIFNK